MKKIKTISLLCIFAFFMTGCTMKADYTITIHKNKSMDLSAVMAFDDELIEALLSMNEEEVREYTEEEKWNYVESIIDNKKENSGIKQERYQEGSFKGVKVSSKIASIDAVSGKESNASFKNFSDVDNLVLFEKNGDKYKLVLKKEFDETIEEGIDEDYQSFMQMNFVITLPNVPNYHNADEVSNDGKTLTWNLLDSTNENIEVEFTLQDNRLLIFASIGGIIAFLIIVGIIITVSKRKSNKNTSEIEVSNLPIDDKEDFSITENDVE